MIVDESVYLEHVGKKGMKWGVRNARASTNTAPRPLTGAALDARNRKIAAQKSARRKKIAQRTLIAGGAIAAGALVAGILLKRHNIKVSQMRSAAGYAKHLERSKSMLTVNSARKVSELRPIVSGRNPFKAPVGLTGLL